jgi:dTDP-glucose 4,6-dehydratase
VTRHRPIAVTGGCGFIGSAFIRNCLRESQVLNIDKGTYAADPGRLEGAHVETIRMDVASPGVIELLGEKKPTILVHFAAETHATRSESDPELFVRTNVEGTRRVLEAAQAARVDLLVHVSTDEVYGPAADVPFREDDKKPGDSSATSAYAKSKAAADDLALLESLVPTIVVRPTNCFGPWQHPEKAIPRWTTRAVLDKPIPVWGDGGYVRDWMFVDDACSAIERIISDGRPGEAYNIGPQNDVTSNREIAAMIARSAGRSDDSVYLTAYDRPIHDRRYSVDATKLRSLGWRPSATLEQRLQETVWWYEVNRRWWEPLVGASEELYDDERPREQA